MELYRLRDWLYPNSHNGLHWLARISRLQTEKGARRKLQILIYDGNETRQPPETLEQCLAHDNACVVLVATYS
nr:hypothetical protein CFP56_01216 [Quercus suber]